MSERRELLVAYDICEPKRLRLTFRKMKGFGEHVQYSVFRCELSPRERERMIDALLKIIDTSEDQVLIADLGPLQKVPNDRVTVMGKPRPTPPRGPKVI